MTPSTITDWQTKCTKLQRLLQDKEEQLKAVTNNKTILHTALQSALEKTRQELNDLQSTTKERNTRQKSVLEDLLRWKSAQQAKELRERLATNGARLGRIVYARAGMRALESWEEGFATKDLETKKQKLKETRKTLESRLANLQSQRENQSQLEAMEAQESIQMHLQNLKTKEQELKDEEQALNDEKGAHIRALKRVASEDASRFRSRPKVREGRNETMLLQIIVPMTDSRQLSFPWSHVS
jgi:tousled-like kinase